MAENKAPHERFVDNSIIGAHVGDTVRLPKLNNAGFSGAHVKEEELRKSGLSREEICRELSVEGLNPFQTEGLSSRNQMFRSHLENDTLTLEAMDMLAAPQWDLGSAEKPKWWVIYSAKECAASEDTFGEKVGFWSNEFGWATLAGATIFTEEDTKTLQIPVIGLNDDARWIPLSEAERLA